MPNPIQYQQTSLGKACYENLWKIVSGLMGSVPVWLLWVRRALVVRGKPTSPCCRRHRLPLHCKPFWNQRHPTVADFVLAIVANQFENNTTLLSPDSSAKANTFWSQCQPSFCHYLLLLTKTVLLSPALSDSQQKRTIADKIFKVRKLWVLFFFVNICSYRKVIYSTWWLFHLWRRQHRKHLLEDKSTLAMWIPWCHDWGSMTPAGWKSYYFGKWSRPQWNKRVPFFWGLLHMTWPNFLLWHFIKGKGLPECCTINTW